MSELSESQLLRVVKREIRSMEVKSLWNPLLQILSNNWDQIIQECPIDIKSDHDEEEDDPSSGYVSSECQEVKVNDRKAFKCPLCAKSYPRKIPRNAHLRFHHKVADYYYCDEDGCGERFTNQMELDGHERANHTICRGCGKKFLNLAGLRHHQTVMNCGISVAAVNHLPDTADGIGHDMELESIGMIHVEMKCDTLVPTESEKMKLLCSVILNALAVSSIVSPMDWTRTPAVSEAIMTNAILFSKALKARRPFSGIITDNPFESVQTWLICDKPKMDVRISISKLHGKLELNSDALALFLSNYQDLPHWRAIIALNELMFGVMLEAGRLFLFDPKFLLHRTSGEKNTLVELYDSHELCCYLQGYCQDSGLLPNLVVYPLSFS